MKWATHIKQWLQSHLHRGGSTILPVTSEPTGQVASKQSPCGHLEPGRGVNEPGSSMQIIAVKFMLRYLCAQHL